MKKFFHKYNRKLWFIFLISLIIGIVVFPKLPESIPIQFGVTGEANSFGSRWMIFMAPVINILMIFFADGLRKIDPKAENYKKFEPQYYNFMFIVALIMLGVQLLTISYVFGYGINIARMLPIIIGLMFIFLGNIMPKFKHNYFIGIRTSWTLASEKVWYLTHRLTGKVWVIGGLVTLFSTFLPIRYIAWVFTAIFVIMVIIPIAASFYFFNKYER